MTSRREFITLLGGAVAWPLAARAQQPERMRRIGLLWGQAANDPEWSQRFTALTKRLQELGWMEGKNISFEIRHAVGNSDRFPTMAA
jgi:putative tryptophan/tyrosine transport system substrate-binding protein